jgi:DNA uptake protein ComE-like DNA-binding protein
MQYLYKRTKKPVEVLGCFRADGRLYLSIRETDENKRTYTATEDELEPIAAAPVPSMAQITQAQAETKVVADSAVNINDPSLSDKELARAITGIGLVTARKILIARNEQFDGKFTSLEDLKTVRASVAWESIEPLIKFE